MSVFNRWLHTLKEGSSYYGLEIQNLENVLTYHLVKANVIQGELEAVSSKTFQDLEEVYEEIPKGSQIFLIYNTAQVIKKETTTYSDLYKQVKQAFPNLKLEDFYYEAYTIGDISEIAICRKEVIDTIIDSFSSQKIYITKWSLNGLLKKSLKEIVKDADIKIEELFLSSFSGTYTLATGNRQTVTSYDDEQNRKKQLFHQERIYKLGLPTAVGFILVALIINFFFFNSYYSEIEELRELTTLNTTQKQLVVKLQNEVAKKEQLIQDVQNSSGSKASYFIDQLVIDLPEEISLKELNYQPLSKTIKEDAPIELQENTIVISGETRENRILSKWISKLERLSFVDKLEITDLEKIEQGLSGFKLKLHLKKE